MGTYDAFGKDGNIYRFTIEGDTPTPEELARVNAKLGIEAPKPPAGPANMGSIEAGFRGGVADLSTALARGIAATGAEETGQRWQDYAQAIRERTSREYQPSITEFGQIGGIGDFGRYLANVGGQSIGYMVPGILGAAAATPLAPVIGTTGTIAAGGGMLASTLPQFFGSNIQEQIEQNKVGLGETSVAPALAAAGVQSALNLVTPAKFGILGRIGGLAGKDVLAPVEQQAVDATWDTFLKKLPAESLKAAMTETATETPQELLTILQANPDKIYDMDEETANRLANAAFGAFVLGGTLGAIGGGKTDAQKLDDLDKRLGAESATASADVIAAKNAWWRIKNIDKGALLKEEEAAALEREADDLIGAVTPKTPRTLADLMTLNDSPVSIFGKFSEDLEAADAVGTGPAPMYSIGVRGIGKGRVPLTFQQKAEPLSSLADITTPNISYIVRAGRTASTMAEKVFEDVYAANKEGGWGASQEDLSAIAFKQAMEDLNPFKDATDSFVFEKSQDAFDAVSKIAEMLQQKELADLGTTETIEKEVGAEGAYDDQALPDEFYGSANQGLTIAEAPTSYTKKQLESAYKYALMVATALGAEAEIRSARPAQEQKGVEDLYKYDVKMMTSAERKALKTNAEAFLESARESYKEGVQLPYGPGSQIAAAKSILQEIKAEESRPARELAERTLANPSSTAEEKTAATAVLEKIAEGKKIQNRRDPIAIEEERLRYKALFEMEDLAYAAADANAETRGAYFDRMREIADSLGSITLYSIDGKSWSDDPQKVASADPKRYSNLLRMVQEARNNPKKKWRGVPPSIKTITIPYWEFYKNASKRNVNGVQMYGLGGRETDVVKDSEEYWRLWENEYFGYGTRPEAVTKYTGSAPSTSLRRGAKDPADLELRKRFKATTGKRPTGEARRINLIQQLGGKPTLFDLDVNMMKGKTFTEILSDINDNYVGFTGPESIGFLQFDEMMNTGRTEPQKAIRRRKQDEVPQRKAPIDLAEEARKKARAEVAAAGGVLGFGELRPDRPSVVPSVEELGIATGQPTTPTAPSAPSVVTLPVTGRYTAKDQKKADKSNKFIGRGSPLSSTARYAEAYGDKANSGTYTSSDVVFVSAEGARAGRVDPDFSEIMAAIRAGADIVTDIPEDRARGYNVGERQVAKFLSDNGYLESSPGRWTSERRGNGKTAAPPAAPPVQPAPSAATPTVTEQVAPVAAEEAVVDQGVSAPAPEAPVTPPAPDAKPRGPNVPSVESDETKAPPQPETAPTDTNLSEKTVGREPTEESPPPINPTRENDVVEGDTFDANDPRWGTPDPTSEPEAGPKKGPSTNSIVRPDLPEVGETTIYSTNGRAWTRDREKAESFGGTVTSITLPNAIINKLGALSRRSGTLYFKNDDGQYATAEQLGAQSTSPVRTYNTTPRAEQAAQPEERVEPQKQGAPKSLTLYSVGGRRWHPNREWVAQYGEVQQATIPTELAQKYGRKVMYNGKAVLVFPEKGKSIREIEALTRKAEASTGEFKSVPEGKVVIERPNKKPVVAPSIKAANKAWNNMSRADREAAVFKDSAGNSYTATDVKRTLAARSSGASLPIPSGVMVVIGPDGKDFTPANSVRGAHLILQGMTGKLRATMKVRDSAGNVYTPAQIQNFVDRIISGERPQQTTGPKTAAQEQAEKDAETKIVADANNIRQAIVQISAALKRKQAAELRAQAEKERLANAPARAAAEKALRDLEDKKTAANKAIRDFLDRIGMKKVSVDIVESLASPQGDIVEGLYLSNPGQGLIKVATDVWSPDMSLDDFVLQVTGVVAHEVVHHMKKANAFSKPEWAALVKHSKNTKARVRGTNLSMTWAQRSSVLNRDEGLTKDRQREQIASIEEEAVAEVLRDFVINGVPQPPMVRGLFRRVLGWIRGLFAYKSAAANQVLENISSGKYNDIAYNVQATGPQNAGTPSIVKTFRTPAEQRREDKRQRKIFEEEQRKWREQEARVGGLTIEAKGTSEGYRQGRGSVLREKRREAMERVAEEARRASEDAERSRKKFEGRRTWVVTDGTPTKPTLTNPTPPSTIKFSRSGVYLDWSQEDASSLSDLAGAGPNSITKYYSFSIMDSVPEAGQAVTPTISGELHGSVSETDPSTFYVMWSNFDTSDLSPAEEASLLRMLRKDLGPDIRRVRSVGDANPESIVNRYKSATAGLMEKYDALIAALRKQVYDNLSVDGKADPDIKNPILSYANLLEDKKLAIAGSTSAADMLYDMSSNAQVSELERLIGSNPGVSRAVSNLFEADERRIDVARVNTAQNVAVKYSKFALNKTRTRQVQNQIVHAAAANIVKTGLSKAGLSSESANWAQRMADEALQRVQDKLLPLGRIVDELRKKGHDITSEMDAYQIYGMMRDRTADRIRILQEQHVTPMLDLMRTAIKFNENDIASLRMVAPSFADFVAESSDINKGMAEAYGIAMHVPERNDVGAQRNPDATNPADLAAAGFETQEAIAAARWFMAHREYQGLKKVHKSMLNLVNYINATRHFYHLSPDWSVVKHGEEFVKAGHPNGFNFYLPMRGIGDEDADIDPLDPKDREVAESMRVGRGISIQYREDKAFLGRGSYVDPATGQTVLNRPPPFVTEHLVQMAVQSIIRGEKNFVGNRIMDLLQTFGGETVDHYGRPVKLNRLFEVMHSAPMERRLVNGVVKMVQDRNYKNDKDVFITKVRQPDGMIREVVIKINEPMLARALVGTNGYGSEDAATILGYIAPFTRTLGELSTKWNPLFPLTNFPRDLAGALINLQQYQIDGLTSSVLKGVLPAASAMWKFQTRRSVNYVATGKEDARSRFVDKDGVDWTDLLEKYQRNGGSFDLFGTTTIADMQKEINESIAPDPSNLAKSRRAFKRVGDFIESYNKTFEAAIRLSTFKSLLESGVSEQDAAWAAKGITTNYSMGGTWKSNATALFMFFNASMQGNMQIISAMARSPKVRGLVASVIVAGIVQDLMMSALAGEDEETGENRYDQIPDYVLQTKMVFVDVTGASENGFLSIAMPYGYNAAHNFGRSLSRLLRGRYEVQDAVSTMFGTFADAFNPIGGSSNLLSFASPTLTDPIVELYLNKDWSGRAIYKGTNPFEPEVPLSQRHWNNTGFISKGFTNFLHTITGGEPMKPGLVEWSPDAIDYLFKYYLGGVGAVVGQTASFFTSTVPRALAGEEWETREVPVLSKFVGNIGTRGNTEKFFKIMDDSKRAEKELRDAMATADYDNIKSAVDRNKQMLEFSGVAKPIGAARSSIMTKVRQIENNTTIPEDKKREMVKELRERVRELENNLLKQYNTRIRDAKVQ